MKTRKCWTALMLILSLFVMPLVSGINVKAEETENKSINYNIELVVDASGSLTRSDAEGNRYTALDIFLQTLREKGHNAGAVVFTEKIDMDTGLSEMNSKQAKDTLSSQIKSIKVSTGDTNIGLALDAAVKRLENTNNDSDNIILLVSDGNTDLGSAAKNEESIALENKAIQSCITGDIKVYGICLNHDNSADLNEFKNICSKTNGAFLEVKSSANLVAALKDFYAQIFNTKFISDTKVIGADGTVTKSIEIPAYGVEELNITISNANKISEITLTKSNGVEVSGNEFAGISSKIDDYYFVKISDPEAGTWSVTVKGDSGTEIVFDYVFNTDNRVGISVNSNTSTFSVNENIEVNVGFYDDGSKLVGNDYYKGYSGTLIVNLADMNSENAQYYPMENNGEQGFKYSLTYAEEGIYEAYAVLSCGEFESASDTIRINIGNEDPEFNNGGEEFITVKVKKLFNNTAEIDVAEYFTDKEDSGLSYSLVASDYSNDAIALEGSTVLLSDLVDGTFTIQAEDSNGGAARGEFRVEVKNYLFLVIAAVIALLVIIISIFIILWIKAKNRFFDGYVNVFSNSVVDDSASKPVASFKGKLYLAEFGLQGHQFANDMHFVVLKDSTVKGNGSHRIQLNSSRPFYYQRPGGEQKVTSLEMNINMSYDIRSHSIENYDVNDDICISLDTI